MAGKTSNKKDTAKVNEKNQKRVVFLIFFINFANCMANC